MVFLDKLVSFYRYSDKFRGFVQTIEGGAVIGFVLATANGFDLSRMGLKALLFSMLGGALTALRNYLINRPGSPPGPILPVTADKGEVNEK